jgi:hypothetical protein
MDSNEFHNSRAVRRIEDHQILDHNDKSTVRSDRIRARNRDKERIGCSSLLASRGDSGIRQDGDTSRAPCDNRPHRLLSCKINGEEQNQTQDVRFDRLK